MWEESERSLWVALVVPDGPALIARPLANHGAPSRRLGAGLAAALGNYSAAEAMYAEGLELACASGHEANVRLLE